MANKKKRKSKKKQRSLLRVLFAFVVFIALIAVVGYLGYKSYTEILVIAEDVKGFTYELPNDATENINLPTKIGESINITWKSSNEEIISNTGEITQPGFESDGETVVLTAAFEIEFKELLSPYIAEFLGLTIEEKKFDIYVPALQATDMDVVKSVLEKLNLIEATYTSITLPNAAYYEGVSITWDSLNDNVMTDSGKVIKPSTDTKIKVKATVSYGQYSEDKNFEITVLSEEETLEFVNDNFDNQATTSKYSTITSTSGVVYYNGRIIEDPNGNSEDTDSTDVNATTPSYIKLRNKDDSNGETENDPNIGSFVINDIVNPKQFSFQYKFDGSQTTEKSKLVITYTDKNGNNTKEEFTVLHKDDFTTFTKDLTNYDEVSIKVEHIDTWSETFILVDNVFVNTNVSINDLEEWVINNTPNAVSKSLILPFTTSFGGEITWESNSNALTNLGIVNRTEEAVTVTLTAKIKYLNEEKIITLEVLVKGIGSVTPLEVYFIDIGKYGAGDCGECTYIKYGDIDIIVDAGDHFGDTIQAINEAINQKLEDGVIEYVIATHPDGDHIGGMASLFETFEIENLIKFEGEYSTNKYKNMKTAYEAEGCTIYEIKSDIIDKGLGNGFITLSSDIYINFIDTTYYTCDESNGKSIVFTLHAYGTTVLMTGDADNASGHTDLEEKYQNIVGDIDILKVVHHGTSNGTTIEYLEVIDPEVAIICNGNYLGNKHGHPTPTALNNLYTYDSDMKVYAITGGGTVDGVVNKNNMTYKCSSEDRFNQRNGLITLSIDNNGYSLSSEYYGTNILEIKDTLYYQAIQEKLFN